VFASLAGFLLGANVVRAEAPAPDQPVEPKGVTVEARGPVHEAFAQPGYAAPNPGLVVPKEPPAPIPEEPPDQKPEGNVQWIPGYWAWDYDGGHFLWVSGFWRLPPPGRRWVPGAWNRVTDGWQWTPGFWAGEGQTESSYLSAPPASLDNGPNVPAPDEDSVYVPGLWVYRPGGFAWRPGYWLGCRPGWIWTPAQYSWTPRGYLYNDGFWDHPLENRGLLFAPVSFAAPLWNDPGWVYRPSCAVNYPCLLSSLFIRPNYCHYYFGDYYGQGYGRLGFQSWVGAGGRYYDPLYGYYRWAHRDNPAWFRDLQALDAGRRNGTFDRPARTLAEQNVALRNNVRNQGAVNNIFANDRNRYLTAVTPLARGGAGLTNVSESQRRDELANIRNFNTLRQQRTEAPRDGDAGRFDRPGSREAATLGRLNLSSDRTGSRAAIESSTSRYPQTQRPSEVRPSAVEHRSAQSEGFHPEHGVSSPHVNPAPANRAVHPVPAQRTSQPVHPQSTVRPASHAPAHTAHVNPAPAHHNPAPRPPAHHSPAPKPPARHR
jgi:hypothetical protein